MIWKQKEGTGEVREINNFVERRSERWKSGAEEKGRRGRNRKILKSQSW